MNNNKIIGKVEQQAGEILRNSVTKSILAGLSGGADSVALLRILLRSGLDVHAVHCNFHLRGAESDRDMHFCEELCRRLEVPLDIVHFDVGAYECEHGVSTEVACRELRYDYFRTAAIRADAERIAVAHHADDNIETLLLNLFRGAGVEGLRAMRPDANGIIRPLITTTRSEILEYLKALNQDYVTDSTNKSSDYRRNFIRNILLPSIETRWPGVRKAMTRTIANLQSDAAVLNMLEQSLLDDDSQNDNGNTLTYAAIRKAPDAEWLLHRWLAHFGCRANVAREIAVLMRVPGNPEEYRPGPGACTGRPATGKQWPARDGNIIAGRHGLTFIPHEEPDDDSRQ